MTITRPLPSNDPVNASDPTNQAATIHRRLLQRMVAGAVAMLLTCLALCASIDVAAAPVIQHFGVTVNNTAKVYPGNVLFVDCANKNPDAWAHAFLVNQSGSIIKQWISGSFQWLAKPLGTQGSILAFRALGSGTTACGQPSGGVHLVKISPTNTVTDHYYDPNCKLTHDFETIGDGTYLILCATLVTDTAVSKKPFFDEIVRRIDANGNVMWSWSTAAHYNQLALSSAGRQAIMNGQTYYPVQDPTSPASSDVFHTNNIQFIPPNNSAKSNAAFTPGNIMVDERNTNLIFVIDYATGNIVWQANNLSIGQHHARIIPSGLPGDGHILFLNNGGRGGYPPVSALSSSVDEYDPIAGALVWQYVAQVPMHTGFFTYAQGSVQRLPNGNTFIDEAAWGRIFEVDPQGNTVWEYLYPFQKSTSGDRWIYRAYKVEPCWPGCNPEISGAGRWTW